MPFKRYISIGIGICFSLPLILRFYDTNIRLNGGKDLRKDRAYHRETRRRCMKHLRFMRTYIDVRLGALIQ